MKFLLVSTDHTSATTRVLAAGLADHNPHARAVVLEAGLRSPRLMAGGDGAVPQVDFGGLRWADFVLALGQRRAGWAALPWVLEWLAVEGELDEADSVAVLDDSFAVLGSLESLFAADGAIAARARHVDDRLGAWGGFAPGLAVVPGPQSWVGWWKDRALDRVRGAAGTTADPWWDLPLDARTITDPALCLSPWTAGQIDLDASGGIGATGAQPLLVDFAGFDPCQPWWFSPPGGEPTVALDKVPALARLCDQHAERLLAAGWSATGGSEPDLLLPGVRATDELRSWYRGLLAESAATGGELPPNPLVPGEVRTFVELLDAPGEADGTGVNRHVDLLVDRREDLLDAFPHARWQDRPRFGRWLWSHGLSEGDSSLLTLPDPPAPLAPVVNAGARRPFGVNLVGYLGADLGLGVAARRMQRAFDAAGIPHAAVSYDRTSSNLRVGATGDTTAPYHFNLLLITPDQLPLFVEDVGEGFLAGHHNIGLWYWESDAVAPQQEAAFGLVDQIWVATHYLTKAFSGHEGTPVRVVPSPLVFDRPAPELVDRTRLGLDDRFTFLFSFDHLSVSERKNPLGLAEAYRRAFPDPDGGTALLLKSINGHIFAEDHQRLVHETSDRSDIIVRDELLPAADRLALVAAADCYVSLHRSEGLGLTMAEAMAVGTPVIATAYSGNLDFMSSDSALMVPATEVEVGPGQYYPAHGHWAEPDLDAAADLMHRVRSEPGLSAGLELAAAAALAEFSYDKVGKVAESALLEAWKSTAP